MKKFFAKLLPLSITAFLVSGFFVFSSIQPVYAASAYSVTEATATVGTATNLEIEYTVDTAAQTWADGDTLTVQLPVNFPQWGSLTYTAEYDTDTNNDGVGETGIGAGGANGQYTVITDTLTVKWDLTVWGAVVNGASTVRILVTAGAVPQYVDTTSTFTWGGATVAAGDTNPTGTDDVNVSAADAAASVVLASPTVGAAGNTTLTVNVPVNMVATDYIQFTAPNNLSVSSVGYGSTTFVGGGAFTCTNPGGQTINCAATGAITAGVGDIVMTGITGIYVAAGQTISGVIVYDTSAAANTATDASGAVTDTVAADAAASLTLANGTVGAVQNTTLNITVPVDMAAGDYIEFDAPNNLNVGAVAFSSETFLGAGTFGGCANAGQTVTCTANGAITAGAGTIIMSNISGFYAATGQTITNVVVYDNSASANTAEDASGTVTDTVAANAGATVTLAGNSVVGASGNTTLNLTLPIDLVNTDTVDIKFPDQIDVSAAAFVSDTFAGGGSFACVGAGQVVTCTADGVITANNGDIVMSGIKSLYAAATDISDVQVEAAGVAVNDIALDTIVAMTDVIAANATASLTLADGTVGAVQNTTLNITVPVDMAAGDYIEFDAPNNLSVASAAWVSESFAGAGDFTCTNTVGQTVRCTTDDVITKAPGTIVMSGITGVYEATGQTITSVKIYDDSASANAAEDASGDVTDTVAADAVMALVLASPTVGATGNGTLTVTVPVDMANTDYIQFSAPANLDVSAVAYSSTNFPGGGGFSCSPTGQTIKCIATGVITAGTGNIVMSGFKPIYAATGQTIGGGIVYDTSAAAGTATDTTPGTVTDTVAADAGATVTLAGNSVVGASGNTTLNLTLPIDLANTDTIDITFPAHLNVSAAAFVSDTFAGAGSFACVGAGQVVTCTADGVITANNGDIVISGIVSLYAAATNVSDVQVEAGGVAANDIATDSSVATTDSTAAALTATDVEPVTLVAGDTGTATVTFTTVNPIPDDGKISVTFGADFDVSGATSGTCTGMDGSFPVTGIDGNMVTIVRSGGTDEPAGVQTCTIDGITNPGTAGTTGTYTIQTTTSGNGVIDQDTAVPADMITAATITSANVQPASLVVNATGVSAVTFTTSLAIPTDGKIKITFGAGFDITGVGATDGTCSSMDGTFVTSVAGQVVTITRQNDGTLEAAGAQTCTIANVKNPGVAGTTGIYTITTTKSTDVLIEQNAAVTADTIIAGTLTATNVQPATLTVSQTGTATATFTTVNDIPADGKIKVIFGAGFDLTGVGAADGACSSMDGTFATAVAGQVVTITRQNDGAAEVAGAQTCTIANVKNPGVAGTTGTYAITTMTSTDGVIDEDTAVAADMITTPPPAPIACNDGTDNDGDGYTDFPNDLGCTSATDTNETDEYTGGGGGGGGGGQTSTTSNTTTSSLASDITTINADQTYSRAVQFESEDITVNTEDNTATVQVTGTEGTLTLKPNSKSTISLAIPSGTSVTGDAEWDGKIKPPLIRSLNNINLAGEQIEGTEDELQRSDVAVLVEVGGNVPLTFSNEVEINIPVDLPDGTVINVYSSGNGSSWIAQGTAVVQNGIAVITTNHLSFYALEETSEVVTVTQQTTGTISSFIDIAGHWAESYIKQIAELGIVNGKTSTVFAPDDNITRAELIKIAVNAFGYEVPSSVTEAPSGDVPVGSWYAPYVKAAKDAGIIYGMEDSFSPNAPATRAFAVTVLAKAAGFTDINENFQTNYASKEGWTYAFFPDVLIGEWYAPYVAYLKDKGVVSGYGNGLFGPANNLTRAEIAKIVVRILDLR